jgi:DNA replication protein DnaC
LESKKYKSLNREEKMEKDDTDKTEIPAVATAGVGGYTPEMLASLSAPDFRIDISKIPKSSGPRPISEACAKITREHTMEWLAEHRRRMQTDPEYVAEWARKDAEANAAWEQQRKEERAAAAERAERERLAASGFPERVYPFLTECPETEALLAAESLTGCGGKTMMLLGGPSGVGKTIAACVAAWRVGGSVRFVDAIDVAQHSAFDAEFWNDLGRCNALVIDDLGSEPLDEKGWGAANVLSVFTKRYNSQRLTWVTLNLSIEKFFVRYGQDGGRLRDRLRECGRYIKVGGKSLRGNHEEL